MRWALKIPARRAASGDIQIRWSGDDLDRLPTISIRPAGYRAEKISDGKSPAQRGAVRDHGFI
jgi:hypothetical protein